MASEMFNTPSFLKIACLCVLKTEDIHPPKTVISVHFSGSLFQWRCKINHFCGILYFLGCFFDAESHLLTQIAHLCVLTCQG